MCIIRATTEDKCLYWKNAEEIIKYMDAQDLNKIAAEKYDSYTCLLGSTFSIK